MKQNRKRVAWIVGAALVALLAVEGHRVAHFLPRVEHFVETLGPWGPLIYIASIVLLEPLLFPNTLFGLTAGVAFGFTRGLLYYASGVYLGNLLAYWLGRRFLRRPVLGALGRHAKVQTAVTAAKQAGTSLVFWLRVLPLNPALFSYAFGAVELPLRAVALGSFGMLSHLVLDVYIGTVAAHVTQMAGKGHTQWQIEGVSLVAGLVVVGIVFWRVARVAKTQVRAAGVSLDS